LASLGEARGGEAESISPFSEFLTEVLPVFYLLCFRKEEKERSGKQWRREVEGEG
jgi:hypothetical protein